MGGKNQPDYGDLAVQQGEANEAVVRNQTYANRPTQTTPWGYTSWNPYTATDPATGETTTAWNQTTGLNPTLQDIFNKQQAIQSGRTDIAGMLTGRMGSEFGTPMDWRGLNPMGQVPTAQFTIPEPNIGDPNAFRQRGSDAMYNQAMSRLEPAIQARREQTEVMLRNQGIGPNDRAWQNQMAAIDQQETDARNQAIWSSEEAGRAESSQMFDQLMGRNQNQYQQAFGANQANFGQAMQASQYANAIRQQQMTEAMQRRGFSLNEINALLSGQQVGMPSMPNFMGATAAQPAPYYQAGVDQGNADAAGSQALWGGLGSLAGAGMNMYGMMNMGP
jgi:hypothetical protein